MAGVVPSLVLLDLSAAFNIIGHGVLLVQLVKLGLGGIELQWFHTQKVFLEAL